MLSGAFGPVAGIPLEFKTGCFQYPEQQPFHKFPLGHNTLYQHYLDSVNSLNERAIRRFPKNNQITLPNRKTALYARVSTADQKNGLEAQIRALRVFCEQNKIDRYEFFADENQSGAKASRPGLDRMMKAVQEGEIETVVVFAFSRFARSVSHMLKGLETFKKHNTNFISLTEKIDLNTSLGHVVFVILSAIAQLERDLIAERVKNGLANARAKGKHIGRVRKRNTTLIESLLDAGLSYREIARIAKCSHGSVHAQKQEWKKRKEKEAAERSLNLIIPSEPLLTEPSITAPEGHTPPVI